MSESTLQIKRTSPATANVSPITLRETPQVRLLFMPTLIDHIFASDAWARGTFAYQRKRQRDVWGDFATIPLSTLKSSEGYRRELRSEERLELFNCPDSLYDLVRREGGILRGTTFLSVRLIGP